MSSVQSSGDVSYTGKDKKVWIEVPTKGKKEKEVNQEATISGNLPVKHDNPSMFSVICLIGTRKLEHAMLDLGSAINIMFSPIYYKF